MALVLTIDGVDRTDYVDSDTFNYDQVANDQVDSLNFTLVIPSSELASVKPLTRQNVVLTLDGTIIYSGQLIDLDEMERDFHIFDVVCSCKDNSHLLTSTLAIDTFEDKTVIYILNNLLNSFANYINRIIDPMETGWSGGVDDTVNFVQGAQSIKVKDISTSKPVTIDLEVFNNGQPSTTDDYIEFWYFIDGDINDIDFISIRLGDDLLDNFFEKEVTTGFMIGWNFFRFKKSSFTSTGSPDWGSIGRVTLQSCEIGGNNFARYGTSAEQGTYSTTFEYSMEAGFGDISVSFDDVRMTQSDAIDKGFINDTFPTIEGTLKFNYIPLFQAIQQLADLVGAYWYVDSAGGFHFGTAGFEQAAFGITDDNGNMTNRSLSLTQKSGNLKNTLYVRGGEFLASIRDERIQLGDGEKTSFRIDYQGQSLRVFVDTGSGFDQKTVGLDNLDADDGTYEWFWNNTEKFVRQATFGSPSPLSATDEIKIDLFPFLPLIVVITDAQAIADNNFRREEFLIVDKNIRDTAGARERGLAELKAYKEDIIEGSFTTLTPGLIAGQQININSALRDRNEDFIIWSISATMQTKNTLRYNVKLISKRKLTLVNTLIQLLLDKTRLVDVSSDEIIDDVEPHIESITMEETHTDVLNTVTAANYGIDAGQGNYDMYFIYS